MLPIGFQTVAKSNGAKKLEALDKQIAEVVGKSPKEPIQIPIDKALALLDLAYANLEFDDASDDLRKAHLAALEHLSRTSKKTDLQGKVRSGYSPRRTAT